jgi:hypothetical protein
MQLPETRRLMRLSVGQSLSSQPDDDLAVKQYVLTVTGIAGTKYRYLALYSFPRLSFISPGALIHGS